MEPRRVKEVALQEFRRKFIARRVRLSSAQESMNDGQRDESDDEEPAAAERSGERGGRAAFGVKAPAF